MLPTTVAHKHMHNNRPWFTGPPSLSSVSWWQISPSATSQKKVIAVVVLLVFRRSDRVVWCGTGSSCVMWHGVCVCVRILLSLIGSLVERDTTPLESQNTRSSRQSTTAAQTTTTIDEKSAFVCHLFCCAKQRFTGQSRFPGPPRMPIEHS